MFFDLALIPNGVNGWLFGPSLASDVYTTAKFCILKPDKELQLHRYEHNKGWGHAQVLWPGTWMGNGGAWRWGLSGRGKCGYHGASYGADRGHRVVAGRGRRGLGWV